MAVAVAVAVAVSGGGAVAVAVPVPVAGLTKRFLNHIHKDFLINVWGYMHQYKEFDCLIRGQPKSSSAQPGNQELSGCETYY